jgi:hypothetical protein
MRSWLVALVLAACTKPAPDCATAIPAGVDRVGGPLAPRVRAKMKEVLIAACTEDHWRAAVIQCIDRASDRAALDACEHQLTPAQRESEHKRTDEVLRLAVDPGN